MSQESVFDLCLTEQRHWQRTLPVARVVLTPSQLFGEHHADATPKSNTLPHHQGHCASVRHPYLAHRSDGSVPVSLSSQRFPSAHPARVIQTYVISQASRTQKCRLPACGSGENCRSASTSRWHTGIWRPAVAPQHDASWKLLDGAVGEDCQVAASWGFRENALVARPRPPMGNVPRVLGQQESLEEHLRTFTPYNTVVHPTVGGGTDSHGSGPCVSRSANITEQDQAGKLASVGLQ